MYMRQPYYSLQKPTLSQIRKLNYRHVYSIDKLNLCRNIQKELEIILQSLIDI